MNDRDYVFLKTNYRLSKLVWSILFCIVINFETYLMHKTNCAPINSKCRIVFFYLLVFISTTFSVYNLLTI